MYIIDAQKENYGEEDLLKNKVEFILFIWYIIYKNQK